MLCCALRGKTSEDTPGSRTVNVISAMAVLLLFPLLLLLLSSIALIEGGSAEVVAAQVSNGSVSQCLDWGEWDQPVMVLEGEVALLRCPLHATLYNYSSTQASGLTLLWYREAPGELQLEEPIPPRQHTKDREWLWMEPANRSDAGKYICMLSNKTFCIRIAMRLEVVAPGNSSCLGQQTAVAPLEKRIPLSSMREFTCPDVDMVRHRNLSYTTSWYFNCKALNEHGQTKIDGDKVTIWNMYTFFEGRYTCVVTYEKSGLRVNFTRVVNVMAVSNDRLPKKPTIYNPDKGQVFTVKQGETAVLTCKGQLPYLEGEIQELFWSVDGKMAEQLGDQRYNITSRTLEIALGDETRETVLRIRDFKQEDLTKEYNCTARNSRGTSTSRANLKEEDRS